MQNRSFEEAVLSKLPNMDPILTDRARAFISDHVGSKEEPKSLSLIKYLTQIIDLGMVGKAAPESIGLPGSYRYHKGKGLASMIEKEIKALTKENETTEQVLEQLNANQIAYANFSNCIIQKTTENIERDRKNWEQRFAKRLDVVKSYLAYTNNFQQFIDQINITQVNQIQHSKTNIDKADNAKFAKLDGQRKDGGQWAIELSKKGKVLVWVAGNAESLGGSTLRPFKTGDAQEEKLPENIPVCFATAAKLGCDVIGGDITYPKEYADNFRNRGALLVQNIRFNHGDNQVTVDAVTVAAPNLEPEKAPEDLKQLILNSSTGATDVNDPKWDLYIKKIYRMFNNLCAATVKALEAGDVEDIICTLPGSGVYSGGSVQAKLILGYCFRLAIENHPALLDKLQDGKVHLPVFSDEIVMAAFLLNENQKYTIEQPGSYQAFDTLDKRIMTNVSELLAEEMKMQAQEKADQKRMAGGLFTEVKKMGVAAMEIDAPEVMSTSGSNLVISMG